MMPDVCFLSEDDLKELKLVVVSIFFFCKIMCYNIVHFMKFSFIHQLMHQ